MQLLCQYGHIIIIWSDGHSHTFGEVREDCFSLLGWSATKASEKHSCDPKTQLVKLFLKEMTQKKENSLCTKISITALFLIMNNRKQHTWSTTEDWEVNRVTFTQQLWDYTIPMIQIISKYRENKGKNICIFINVNQNHSWVVGQWSLSLLYFCWKLGICHTG